MSGAKSTETAAPLSAFWNLPLARLKTELELPAEDAGLSTDEAARRRERFGPNDAVTARRVPLVLQFLARFRNPLILILLTASALSAATGDLASFLIIAVIVLLGVVLDFVQEVRAERTAEALRGQVALTCRVVRDGSGGTVPARELVPGDLVELCAGDLIPADGRLLAAKDFFVNQALLTGEPYPVEKHSGDPTEACSEPGQASAAVFMGSSVICGSATLRIVRTGRHTALGSIARSLGSKAPPNDFEQGTRQFGMLIVRVTVLLVLFVVLANALLHRPWLEALLFALALAVGLTPELLPMVTTVTLARGALRLSQRRVIVKRLSAMHNLGAMQVLCTDKTGTLTEARIRLVRHVDWRGEDDDRVFELAYLNSHFETGMKSTLDEAILEHGQLDVSAWRKLDEVPFDFERRRVSVLVQSERSTLLAVKGAPEDVLRCCSRYRRSAAEVVPLDDDSRRAILDRLAAIGRDGFRVLAIAWREVPSDHRSATLGDEAELTFAGFATFLDPPKATVSAALAQLGASGVEIKVLTGDNEQVTRHLAEQVGLAVTGVLTGSELAALSDEALLGRLPTTNLFCRVSPQDKLRIILALKRRGLAVGFLGDGLNDAPALHGADIGISVDSATDVAKEAADIILLDRDLSVVHDGVSEGRRTFVNVIKYVLMATSSNFGNMLSMAAAAALLPFLPMRPVQVLLNNLLYDLSEVAIPFDHVDETAVARPRRWDAELVRRFMLVLGPLSSLFDLLTFALLLRVFHAPAPLFQTGWFVESLASQALVIFIIRTRRSFFRSRPHPLLAALSVGVVVVAALLPFLSLGRLVGFVPIPVTLLLALVGMVLAYLGLAELTKHLFFRYLYRDPGAPDSRSLRGRVP